jgi:hypothetical protein
MFIKYELNPLHFHETNALQYCFATPRILYGITAYRTDKSTSLFLAKAADSKYVSASTTNGALKYKVVQI